MATLTPSDATLLESRWMRTDARRTIAAGPDRVWDLLGDTGTWADWYTPLSVFEPTGQPASGLGAKFREQEWLWKTECEVVEFDEGHAIGTSTSSINIAGLLTKHYRRASLEPVADGTGTAVTIAGAFRFGPLGWILVPYTYPQMIGSLYFEYRSALKGLAAAIDGG